MGIDISRHVAFFDPNLVIDPIHIIGVGATGSKVAKALAKLGLKTLSLWDPDTVEAHNIANQDFSLKHIGEPKVKAAQEIIKEAADIEVDIHQTMVTGKEKFSGIIFLLTDTMASRKAIWEGAIRFQPSVQRMFETRLGVDSLKIASINPLDPSQIERWEATLCDDEDTIVSECGSKISVGPTGDIVSGLVVFQFIRWFNDQKGLSKNDTPENEILISLRGSTQAFPISY